VGELPFADASLEGVRRRLSSADKFPDVRDKVHPSCHGECFGFRVVALSKSHVSLQRIL